MIEMSSLEVCPCCGGEFRVESEFRNGTTFSYGKCWNCGYVLDTHLVPEEEEDDDEYVVVGWRVEYWENDDERGCRYGHKDFKTEEEARAYAKEIARTENVDGIYEIHEKKEE